MIRKKLEAIANAIGISQTFAKVMERKFLL